MFGVELVLVKPLILTQIGNVFMSNRSSLVASDGKMPFNWGEPERASQHIPQFGG